MEEEEQEDEDAIIEKRRLQRLAILQKYQGTTSNAPSIATSLVSQSPSGERSDSEDSDAVEKLATEDLEKEIALANSQTRNEFKDAVQKGNDSKQESETKSGVGDMFADDDMFSDNYSVSIESYLHNLVISRVFWLENNPSVCSLLAIICL